MSWFVTFTGRRFFPLNPDPVDIQIEDIAHALAHQCRFAGHVRTFYSVAQHSVLVSENLPPSLALIGLLHDAAEAYCQDIIRPIKHSEGLEGYRQIERRMERTIASRWDLTWPWPPEVKEADNRALMTERRDLLPPHTWEWFTKLPPFPERITPQPPEVAKERFLSRYHHLQEVSR
jgi:5'-deoxynucleotidase YfbR-like HD superfamily hydrolase